MSDETDWIDDGPDYGYMPMPEIRCSHKCVRGGEMSDDEVDGSKDVEPIHKGKMVYDKATRSILPLWAKDRIRELEQERDSLKAEVERMRQELARSKDLYKEQTAISAERCIERDKIRADFDKTYTQKNVEIDRLRTEVERLRLKWQTGPIPEDGIYRLRAMGSNQIGWLGECVSGSVPTDPLLRLLEWAGPIPESEEGK